jgi:hypothetical protein
VSYLGRLRSEATAIHLQLTELVVYSEGAFSWSEVWFLSGYDRETAIKVINDFNRIKSGKPKNEFL